jgi:hypothetical protein
VLTGGVNLLTDYLHSSEAQHCVECDNDTTSGVFFTRAAIPTPTEANNIENDARWMAVHHCFGSNEELQRNDSIDSNRNQRRRNLKSARQTLSFYASQKN